MMISIEIVYMPTGDSWRTIPLDEKSFKSIHEGMVKDGGFIHVQLNSGKRLFLSGNVIRDCVLMYE